MNTIKIDILNPKATKLLNSLVELELIAIRDESENGFSKVLKKLRSKGDTVPSLEEITQEVELVRSRRYDKKSN